MIIYSPIPAPRLHYAGDLLAELLSGQPAVFTDNLETFYAAEGIRINYSDQQIENSYWIRPYGLLTEKGIREQKINCFTTGKYPVFFGTGGDHSFDLLSAIFYLVSRYEEYLPHQKDKYGRYAHDQSLAWREGFLSEPLVNRWVLDLKSVLHQKFGVREISRTPFKFLPTYDIDEAWSFLHKSDFVNFGGMLKDLLRNPARVRERMAVRAGRKMDPFDSYAWMDSFHDKMGLSPKYFFLVAQKRSRYDRNISPAHPAFRTLIKEHVARYEVGIHPSWQSTSNGILEKEISLLDDITGKKTAISRQHFISFNLPGTFRSLINAGIREDHSMGYGSVNGFRASIASPFYWYDLEKDEQTTLLLHPFCFMDANSFFEQKQTPEQACDEMKNYHNKVKQVSGTFISIWHNTFLGTDPLFTGWREAYEKAVSSFTGH